MLIAEREGLERADASRAGAIALLLVWPVPMAVMITRYLARRETRPAETPGAQTRIPVPDVTFGSKADSTKKLENLEFKVLSGEVPLPTTKDFVVGQQPAANTPAAQGSIVTLKIVTRTN